MILRKFQERYKAGEFSALNVDKQIEAGWVDWFCPDSSLAKRLTKMWKILKSIINDDLLDNYEVTFYNSCPFNGPLYDYFILKPVDESKCDEMTLVVVIDDKRKEHKYELSSINYGYQKKTGFTSAPEVAAFLNNMAVA